MSASWSIEAPGWALFTTDSERHLNVTITREEGAHGLCCDTVEITGVGLAGERGVGSLRLQAPTRIDINTRGPSQVAVDVGGLLRFEMRVERVEGQTPGRQVLAGSIIRGRN